MPTILIAEDELVLRIDLAHQLRASGFEVIEAASADAAVSLLETHPYVARGGTLQVNEVLEV